jgi:hypothetical protein
MIYFTNKWNPMSLDVVRCCLRPDESLDLVLRPADTVYDTLYKIFRSKFRFQFPNCDARDSMTFPVEAVRGVEPEVEKVTRESTSVFKSSSSAFAPTRPTPTSFLDLMAKKKSTKTRHKTLTKLESHP